MNILVVDDDNDTRHLFSLAFDAAGHQVTTAATGSEALEVVEKRSFDAVLLDVEMPQMSGWKVLKSMQNRPEGKNLLIIMFTAYGNERSDAYAKMLGAYALVHKPVSANAILTLINCALQDQRIGTLPAPLERKVVK